MKEIKAIIQPFMLPKVISALKEHEDLPGITVSEVKGFGKTRAVGAKNIVVEESIGYVRKVKLEIVLPDHLVEEVIAIIYDNAHTGQFGDGKVFVSAVDDVMKIRTGGRGEEAI